MPPEMPIRTSAKMKLPKELASIIGDALLPEVERPTSDRSRVSVETGIDVVKISIEASDISALRAALNSYLRWIESILDVVEVARLGQKS